MNPEITLFWLGQGLYHFEWNKLVMGEEKM